MTCFDCNINGISPVTDIFLMNCMFVVPEGKVLLVIGGDDQYSDEDEKERAVISRWARRKVASQFNEECLDGRRSFIFSWNKQHREIHEEALLHYFDPSKKGKKFEYQPKPKPVPVPKRADPGPQKDVVCYCLFVILLEKDWLLEPN